MSESLESPVSAFLYLAAIDTWFAHIAAFSVPFPLAYCHSRRTEYLRLGIIFTLVRPLSALVHKHSVLLLAWIGIRNGKGYGSIRIYQFTVVRLYWKGKALLIQNKNTP